MEEISPISLEEVRRAAKILQDNGVYRTPLIPLHRQVRDKQIYLKLENLQPVGSFKIRGATNAIGQISEERLHEGVYTGSAGNFGQGLAWSARKLGVSCTVVVPDTAPAVKLDAMRRLGADVRPVSYDAWWQIMKRGKSDDVTGTFIHPVCDKHVIAGNGVMGIEIYEDLPDVDTVICPWGGGGNATGIASALKILRPEVKVIACEIETGAPLTASFKAGFPTDVENHRPSFVDGMNGKSVFPQMWNLAKKLIDDSIVLSSSQICDAIRLLVDANSLVTEGAGAATVAAAMTDEVAPGKIVCVISGGNIDLDVLGEILQNHDPK